MPKPRWFVCDMDDGALRVEATRRAALAWWMAHTDSNVVRERHAYAPGYYGYVVGRRGDSESGSDVAIVRQDKLLSYGLAIPPGGVEAIRPVFPHADRPHEDSD